MVVRSHQLCLVLAGSSGVAVWVEEHLRVAVDGHEGFNVAVRRNKVHNGFDFGFRVSSRAAIRLRAGASASAGACRSKLVLEYLYALSTRTVNTFFFFGTSKSSVPVPVGVDSNAARS